jgi:glyoxylase-like metal-dependent hydrolase (beta-lactamase superfamily II)
MTLILVLLAWGSFLASGCALTGHAHRAAQLGQSRRSADLLAVIDQPGPVTVETINSADWAVDRSGLIDLKDARASQLGDGPEPIQVFFHVIRHPQRGTFIVDTGIERALRDDRPHAAIRGFIARYMHLERLDVHVALGDWLRDHRVDGVMLTHLHLDHVSGMPDVPHGTPIYAGPRETDSRTFANLFVRSSIDRALAGQDSLAEWQFAPDADGRFAGVLDVFGDGSVWAIWAPGHTPGSTAYLVRTPDGPVLLTGDVCHTRWGWEHDVAPGSFTADHAANADSLARLRRLVAEHPAIEVRLGHQRLAPSVARK